MKKILVLFTVMLVALAATAQKNMDGLVFGYTYHGNELYYKIHGSNVSVTSEVKSANFTSTVEIPQYAYHKGKKYRVTRIEKHGFSGANNVRKIIVPGTINEMPVHGIKDCPDLRELVLKDGVQFCTSELFVNCPKMKTIYAPADCGVEEKGFKQMNINIIRR